LSFGRITDDGAWTTWFGHIVPTGTDITTGTMIRHGDAPDPDPAENRAEPSQAHRWRTGAIGGAPNP
jgi:hypothetical protein